MGDDAYAVRNRRKKAKGSACLILVVIGGSLFVGLTFLLAHLGGVIV